MEINDTIEDVQRRLRELREKVESDTRYPTVRREPAESKWEREPPRVSRQPEAQPEIREPVRAPIVEVPVDAPVEVVDTVTRLSEAAADDDDFQSVGKCKGCGDQLELCPHCFGGDAVEGGRGQRGYYICRDDQCSEYEICCGC